MVLYKKEREFFNELLKQVPALFFSRIESAPYLWTFEVEAECYQLDQYKGGTFSAKKMSKTFKFWKPMLKFYAKRHDSLEVRLESSNGMSLHLDVKGNSLMGGTLVIRNHNKSHRWSVQKNGNFVTRTFCDPYMEYQITSIKNINLW